MLNLTKVSKYYQSDDNVTQALKNISLNFQLGEFVAITGESGSGKTTLLNVISGLDSYEDGSMRIADDETQAYDQSDWEEYRKRYISFVFQNYNLIDAYTVYENIEIALTLNHPTLADKKTRILELIEQVGLSDHVNQKASKLSGGQKQRVSIARALAKDAPILVADEPTGNLDSKTAETIVKLLRDVSKDKLVIFVTHEYELVKDVASRRIRLFDGEIVEDKTIKPFDPHVYTPKTLSSITLFGKLKLALKNLKSTPKRTLFMGMISLFIVAIFASSYGSYVQQSNVSNSMFHPLFENLHPSRLVITKQDSTSFTDAEINQLSAESGVEAVVRFDPVLDVYGIVENQQTGIVQQSGVATQFILGSEARLSSGRMPENAQEIALTEDVGYAIGDEVIVYLTSQSFQFNERNLNASNILSLTVVGLHDESTEFLDYGYVNSSFLNSDVLVEYGYFSISQWQIKVGESSFSPAFDVSVNTSLEENEILLSQRFAAQFFDDETGVSDIYTSPVELSFNYPYLDQPERFNVTLLELINEQEEFGYVPDLQVSQKLMATVSQSDTYQISLLMDGSFSANALNDNLPSEFIGIYPAGYENPFEQIFSVIGNLFQGVTSVILLLIMYFISYFVLKNVIRSQEQPMLILRSIGGYKKDIYQTLIMELTIVMLSAFFIVIGFLWINQIYLNWVTDYLQYFAWNNYVFMTVLLLGLAVLLARRFQSKLFKRSVMSALRSA